MNDGGLGCGQNNINMSKCDLVRHSTLCVIVTMSTTARPSQVIDTDSPMTSLGNDPTATASQSLQSHHTKKVVTNKS